MDTQSKPIQKVAHPSNIRFRPLAHLPLDFRSLWWSPISVATMTDNADSKETGIVLNDLNSRQSSKDERVEVIDVSAQPVVLKVYKRRFLGLLQLFLLNVVASWDVSFA